jgi:hypothetical protein
MLRMFSLVGRTDDSLESSWRARNWATFIRVWLTASVGLMALGFVAPFVLFYFPASMWNIVAWVIGMKLLNYPISHAWDLGEPFGAMTGLFTLIFTVPAMMLKQVSGEFR